MHKLIDRIETLHRWMTSSLDAWKYEAWAKQTKAILADVRELEEQADARKFGTAYHHGVSAGIVSGARQLQDIIRAAKREAYKHALQLLDAAYERDLESVENELTAAIDVLDTEASDNE